MDYISNTELEKSLMLEVLGLEKMEDLFRALPEEVLLKKNLNLPEGMSELELSREMKKLASRNRSIEEFNCFLGAGAYDHFIPAIIQHLISRSEYYTAYTPYQAELSQGTLQVIYEYQSMICELTAMEAANASLLDGGSAVGEAVNMAGRISRRRKIIMPDTVHPAYRKVAETYGLQQNLEFVKIPQKGTVLDLETLEKELDGDTAAVVVQYPNFFGSIENLLEIKKLMNVDKKILLTVVANPIALAVLTPPGELDADIVVGEGQSLGNPVSYGGPYLGFMACKMEYIRQMPGRIVGATTDLDGNKGFVLTLQAREQHIRREKATSNICTNEALNALAATIYLSVMGKEGLRKVAEHCLRKAHYLGERLADIPGFKLLNGNNYFHEFLLETPLECKKIIKDLQGKGILAGVDIKRFGYEIDGLLVCVTEKKSLEDMDSFVEALEVYSNV
ncbi:MAG: aminomethyl-transferring glycine dehydrogenase subunit GcvPA [Halanaerobiaceae bacterium]|nr:aminomethyl-transferring glycine dehydrogenase subunit GcvPA [Halanaerobiaceae bacterium]